MKILRKAHLRIGLGVLVGGYGLSNLPPIGTNDDTTVGQFLDEMDAGMHSWTWRVPDEVRRRVGPQLRTWAEGRFGSLERPVEPDLQILWRAYDLP